MQDRQHQGGLWGMALLPTFWRSKKAKGKQRQKRRNKAETIKGCHQGQNITILAILERLEFKKIFLSANNGDRQCISVFHDPSTRRSISPALK